MNPHGDAELISRVRSGDLDAYADLFGRHAAAARALARCHTRTRIDAADLVTESSIRALASVQQGAGPDVAFRLYLFDCINETVTSMPRRRRKSTARRKRLVPLTVTARDGTRRDLLAQAFASLPERWQAALWHADVEGEPAATVGRHLGLDDNAVAALDYRAREALRQEYVRLCLEHESRLPCRAVQERLSAHMRRLLVGGDGARVTRHLRSCPRCESLRVDLADLPAALTAAVAPRYLGSQAGVYLDHLARSRTVSPLTPQTSTRRRWPVTAAAAVAIAALAVGALWTAGDRGPVEAGGNVDDDDAGGAVAADAPASAELTDTAGASPGADVALGYSAGGATGPAEAGVLPVADVSLAVRDLTATVTNHGPNVASSVRVEVTLRRTSDASPVPRRCVASSAAMRCTYGVGNIGVGGQAQIPLPAGTLLTVTAGTSVADPNPSNNEWAIMLGGPVLVE